MVDVILIDDEEPALLELEFLLKGYNDINILGRYTNPYEAMEKIALLKPHGIFIDINMPQLSGMTLIKKLKESKSEIDVIFVTAHEKYAVEAFRVEAVDYLLKPVSRECLNQTVNRLLRRKGISCTIENNVPELRCIGELQLRWTGKPPIKWRTEKEKELFAFLLNREGQQVSRDRIIDRLWGDYEVGRAVRLLHNSIYYVKKTLEEYGIKPEHINISGRYCLKLGDIWYDKGIIENKMGNLNAMQTIEDLENILKLFQGQYLQFEGWTWAEQERELLRQYELDLLVQLSRKYTEAGILYKAELALKNAYHNNPYDENITYMLMELYKNSGEIAKAARHYIEYYKMLKDELGINPQERIVKIYESVQNINI